MTPPTPTEIQNTFLVEKCWTAAHHVAFKRFHRSMFKSPEPWNSTDKKELRHWKTFMKMAKTLLAEHLDLREFCTAIAEHKARKVRECPHSPMRFFPNPSQAANVNNPKIRAIWEAWRQDHLEKGYNDPAWVTKAAKLGTLTPEEKLRQDIYRAYTDCEREGTDAPSLDWGPELVWLFWTTEPDTRPIFRILLDDLKRTNLKSWESWNAEFGRIRENPRLKHYLYRLKREATGKTLIRSLRLADFFSGEEGGQA